MQLSDTISAKARSAGNKGVSHKLRAAGSLPAVVYGPGSEPMAVALDPKTFVAQRRQYGLAHMFGVELEGEQPFKAFIREIQCHPITGEALHVDLYKVDMTRPIRMSVRIELVGKPIGIVSGGVLSQALHQIELKGLPGLIPESVQADVSGLDIGDSLHVSELVFPEGVKSTLHHDEAIAVVSEPERAEEKGPGAGEGAAAAVSAAGAAPAAGAPAAKGAAPAKAPAGGKAPAKA